MVPRTHKPLPSGDTSIYERLINRILIAYAFRSYLGTKALHEMKTSNLYLLLVIALSLPTLFLSTMLRPKISSAQTMVVQGCMPISQRTRELGCWVLTDAPMRALTKAQAFWHLDVYPTRAAAEADRGPRSTIVESLGKVWLLSIEGEAWHPATGQRVSKIGPLPITAGEKYSAQYMEAHIHSGYDFGHPQPPRPGSLVHLEWRNLSGNVRRRANRTSWRTPRDCTRRFADAAHCHRL